MKARNLGLWVDRACSYLFLAGLFLLVAREVHAIAWPWWCVLLPWIAVLAVFVSIVLFMLVVAAVEEWRCARRRSRAESWFFAAPPLPPGTRSARRPPR